MSVSGYQTLYLHFQSCFGHTISPAYVTVDATTKAIDGFNYEPVNWSHVNSIPWAKRGRRIPPVTISGNASIRALFSRVSVEPCGIPVWRLAAITVLDGGSGYTDGQSVSIQVDDINYEYPFEYNGVAYGIAEVDEDGAIVGVSITDPGEFWAESAVDAPYADTISVAIVQYRPGAGNGAVISAVLDLDPNSEDFGTITDLNIDAGGSGYTPTISLIRPVTVEFLGHDTPPVVTAVGAVCNTAFTTETLIDNCNNFSFSATFGEQTAEVSETDSLGVFYGSNKCCEVPHVCCPEMPTQVVVSIRSEGGSGYVIRASDNPDPVTVGFSDYTIADAFETTCPSEDIEVVLDLLNLVENQCQRLVDNGPYALCGGSRLLICTTGGVSISQPTTSGDLVLTPVGGGDPITVAAFQAESLGVGVILNIVGACTLPPTITEEYKWSGRTESLSQFGGATIAHVADAVVSRALFPGQPCNSFPDGWSESETLTGTVPGIEAGELYEGLFRFVVEGNVRVIPVTYRRVCADYQVEVDFQ
jgi:hypothetical protein